MVIYVLIGVVSILMGIISGFILKVVLIDKPKIKRLEKKIINNINILE